MWGLFKNCSFLLLSLLVAYLFKVRVAICELGSEVRSTPRRALVVDNDLRFKKDWQGFPLITIRPNIVLKNETNSRSSNGNMDLLNFCFVYFLCCSQRRKRCQNQLKLFENLKFQKPGKGKKLEHVWTLPSQVAMTLKTPERFDLSNLNYFWRRRV